MLITIRSMLPSEVFLCVTIACASPIGTRYGFDEARLSKELLAASRLDNTVFVAKIEEVIAGFVWIDPRGAFSSAPYLRLIAVDKDIRGSGVGSALLQEFERRTAEIGRDFCLLVSDFNERAIAFYERHGYKKAGFLPDFACPGITEILMVKNRKGWGNEAVDV
ncbi:MAG: GNAT family N-acetyltransferase [Bacteroidetes bacterium]|nr:GNAT family N-acetyltransferase [Bacteroidota bacterium]